MKKIRMLMILTAGIMISVAGCKEKSSAGDQINGTITFVRGDVFVNESPASIGAIVNASDTITVKNKSTAVVQFSSNAMVTIESNSVLAVEKLLVAENGNPAIALNQKEGSSFHKIMPDKADYTINTPTVTAGVRGTSFRVSVAQDKQDTEIELYKGEVALIQEPAAGEQEGKEGASEPKEILLVAGHKAVATETTVKPVEKLTEDEAEALAQLDEIAFVPATKLDKIETDNESEEAKELMADIGAIVMPVKSQETIIKLEEEAEIKKVTIDDLKAQYGKLSTVLTKEGKSYVGAFQQVGDKIEIITVDGKKVIPVSSVQKVSPY